MSGLFGGSQQNTAMQAQKQQSLNDMMALQRQNSQNAVMQQQQTEMQSLVDARTAALSAQLGPAATQPYALNGLPTISTSVLGDQSSPQTNRNSLLGNA